MWNFLDNFSFFWEPVNHFLHIIDRFLDICHVKNDLIFFFNSERLDGRIDHGCNIFRCARNLEEDHSVVLIPFVRDEVRRLGPIFLGRHRHRARSLWRINRSPDRLEMNKIWRLRRFPVQKEETGFIGKKLEKTGFTQKKRKKKRKDRLEQTGV